MTPYSKKKSWQVIIFSSTSLTLIGLLVIILISIPLVKNIQKQLNVNNEISTLDQEIVDLEKKNTELKDLISYLNSDQFTEEQARLNLNYKKKGEELVIIKTNDSEQEKSLTLKSIYNIKGLEAGNKIKTKTNVQKWIKYFWN
jgi:cell division protein FtsB